MFGQYFYHEILRKTVIGFGTLFNDIEVRHSDNNGDVQSRMKVPLAYGPMQKFLAKIEQQPQLQGRAAITLPRMSFEMTGISYRTYHETWCLATSHRHQRPTPHQRPTCDSGATVGV